MFNFFKKSSPSTSSEVSEKLQFELADFPGVIQFGHGFPQIQWDIVQEALNSNGNNAASDATWTGIAMQWLNILRNHLGPHYRICEGKHLLLLSTQMPDIAADTLRIGDYAYAQLEAFVKRDAVTRGFGKHVVLIFATLEIYYDYISHFYKDSNREYGTSAGVSVSRGYRHTAINGKAGGVLRTLTHELAHDVVRHLPLPLWLNEGFAMNSESLVSRNTGSDVSREQARLQHRYWSWFGTDHFWNGEAFRFKSSQGLSYQLARVIFENLASNRKRRAHLGVFVTSAHRDDSGESACQKCFGCSLSDLVAEFLGPGAWGPGDCNSRVESL